jgi:DNA repair exonuclease SbcCD ATPase subunit
MLKLISLKFNNIGKYTSEQLYDFTNMDNLVLIDGMSGAGKSTIFHALNYLFGVNTIPATQLQNRSTKKPIYVEGIFTKDEKQIVIKRHKKEGLSIITEKETIEGSIELVEEKLNEIIGIDRKIFKRMIYKPQKESGFFLNMTNKQMYEFLIDLLELKPYYDKIELITLDIKDKEKEIEKLKIETEMLNKALANPYIDIKKPECNITEKHLSDLNKKIISKKEEIETLKQNLISELNKIEKPITIPIESNDNIKDISKKQIQIQDRIDTITDSIKKVKDNYYNQIRTTQDELNKHQSISQELEYKEKQLQENVKKIQILNKQLEILNQNQCPTCTQKWLGASHQEKYDNIIKDIRELQSECLKYKNLKQEKQAVNQKILEYTSLLKNTIEPDTSEQSKEIKKLQEILYKLKSEGDNIVLNIKNENLKKQNNFYNKVKEVEELFKPNIKTLKEEVSKLNNEYTKDKSTFMAFTQSIKEYNANISKMEESKRFQQTKSGSLKDEINAIISKTGDMNINVKTLSGGERTVVDLAVDLALIDTIETKVGKGADFFIIDEPFDGLDSVGKEQFLNILTSIDSNKRIIIVDHDPILKDMISDKITIN